MPYIAQVDRESFEYVEHVLKRHAAESAGEIQYLIALVIKGYMSNNDYRYQTMNDVMGALNGANLEFYRRYVGPYEDECIAKNGDVIFERTEKDSKY